MPNKKNVTDEKPIKEAEALSELDQLRQIVFGEAQQRIMSSISHLRDDLENALLKHKQSFTEQLTNMQAGVDQQFSDLENKIQFIDQSHDTNEAKIEKELASLASEHEMFVSATQQDLKNIEQSLDNESSSLSNTFNEQLDQLKHYLEDVSKELSSTKTDRKTLAKLLATMATNLEDDQL